MAPDRRRQTCVIFDWRGATRHHGAVSRTRVLILGSTGSIGTQALEVIAANPDRFEVVGLAAGGGNPGLLAQQRAETGVTNVAVADDAAAVQVGDVTFAGPESVTRLVENTEADVVLNALVGALGLKPTLAVPGAGRNPGAGVGPKRPRRRARAEAAAGRTRHRRPPRAGQQGISRRRL